MEESQDGRLRPRGQGGAPAGQRGRTAVMAAEAPATMARGGGSIHASHRRRTSRLQPEIQPSIRFPARPLQPVRRRRLGLKQ